MEKFERGCTSKKGQAGSNLGLASPEPALLTTKPSQQMREEVRAPWLSSRPLHRAGIGQWEARWEEDRGCVCSSASSGDHSRMWRSHCSQGWTRPWSHSTGENEAPVSVQADEWFWQSEVWRDHSLVLACGVLAGLEAQRERTPPTPWAGGSVFGDGIHGRKERSFS